MKKIILIDNYDSFTFNLYHYLSSLKVNVDVIRNDQITSKEILKKKLGKKNNFEWVFPPKNWVSENAAMIAWAGIERYKINLVDSLEFESKPRWPLDMEAPFLKGPGLKL